MKRGLVFGGTGRGHLERPDKEGRLPKNYSLNDTWQESIGLRPTQGYLNLTLKPSISEEKQLMKEDYKNLTLEQSREVKHYSTMQGYLGSTLKASRGKESMIQKGHTLKPSKEVKNRESTRGYLLVGRYGQQLMNSIVSFYHVANITALLNLSSVEPFITPGGELAGAPNTKGFSNQFVMRLSHFFVMEKLKTSLRTCCSGNDLVRFETFVNKASRDVVIVKFLASLDNGSKRLLKGKKVAVIDNAQGAYLNSLNNLVKKGTKAKSWNSTLFRVSRMVLIDARPESPDPLPLGELIKELDTVVSQQVAKYGSATFVINNFRDIQMMNAPSGYFYSLPPGSILQRTCSTLDNTAYTQSVVSAARQFRESLSGTRHVIGIHIRGEKLLLGYNGSHSQHMNCLKDLKRFVGSGAIPVNVSHGDIYLFHDLDKHASHTCNNYKYCKNGRKEWVASVKELGYRIIQYDPSKFHPASHKDIFAALVVIEYLSNVDYLVTVGRGQYQDTIVSRFTKNRGETLYHRICFG